MHFTPLAAQQQDESVFAHVTEMSSVVVSADPLDISVTIKARLHTSAVAPAVDDADGRVLFCTITMEDPTTGEWVQAVNTQDFTSAHVPAAFITLGGEFYFGTPGSLILCEPLDGGMTTFIFQPLSSMIGKKIRIIVQGVLRPTDPQDPDPTDFIEGSVNEFQMLLTEEFSFLERQL